MGGKKNKKQNEQQKNKEVKTELQTEDIPEPRKKEEQTNLIQPSQESLEKVKVQNTSEKVTENSGEANISFEQIKPLIGSSQQKDIGLGSDLMPKEGQQEQHQSKEYEVQKQTNKRLNEDEKSHQYPQIVSINNQQSQPNHVLQNQNQNILKHKIDSQVQQNILTQQAKIEPQTKHEHQLQDTAHRQKQHNSLPKNEQQLTTSVALLLDASIIQSDQKQLREKTKKEQTNTNDIVQSDPKQQDVKIQGEKPNEEVKSNEEVKPNEEVKLNEEVKPQIENIDIKTEHTDQPILQNNHNLDSSKTQAQEDISGRVQEIKQNQRMKTEQRGLNIELINSDQHQVVIHSHVEVKRQPEIEPKMLDKPKDEQNRQSTTLNNNQHSAQKTQSREIDINQAVEESDYNSSQTKWQGNQGHIFTMVESYDVSDDSQKINIENSQEKPIEMKQSLSFSDLNSSLPIYSRSQDEPQHQQMKKQERAQEELANNQIEQLDIKAPQIQNVNRNEAQQSLINLQENKKVEEALEEPKILEHKPSKPWERLGLKKAKQDSSKQIAPSPGLISAGQPTHPKVQTEAQKQIVEQKTQVIKIKVQEPVLVSQSIQEKKIEVRQSDETIVVKTQQKNLEEQVQQQVKQEKIEKLNEEQLHEEQQKVQIKQEQKPVTSEIVLQQNQELVSGQVKASEEESERRKKRIEELQKEKSKIPIDNKNNKIFKGICSIVGGVAVGGLSFFAKKDAKTSIAMALISGFLFTRIL